MICKTIALKDRFPFLGDNGKNPDVTVYLPDPMAEMKREDMKRPCLVLCPGGGYGMVSQREGEPIAFHFLSCGFNIFVIRYSVAPHRFPTQLREVAAVMELIYENQEQWHCDVNRVAIMGFSAGGHLAAHYSTCYDISEVRQAFPDSKPVQATVLSYPVISADPGVAHLGSFQNLLGVQELSKEQEAAFSCDKRVTEKTPPAFLWHTAADNLVPVANTLRYAEALSRYGIPFAVRIYPFGWHGLATVDAQTNDQLPDNFYPATQWLVDACQWLQMILK